MTGRAWLELGLDTGQLAWKGQSGAGALGMLCFAGRGNIFLYE